MVRCAGKTRDGSRCEVVVGASKTYCYQHDPANADRRKRAAAKGGRSKPNRELRDIKERLSSLVDDVLEGSVGRGNAAVAGQLINTLLRAFEVERKIRETEDLGSRIDALERTQQTTKGGRAWRGA